MHGKSDDEAATRRLIEGLDGIYVREYEFDKEGEYSPDDIEKLRKTFATPEWSPIIHEHERRSGETSDVMVKLVNGESRGMFILAAEPKELTIVLILGPIRIEDLGKLHSISGLGGAFGPLGPLGPGHRVPGDVKDKSKDKVKEKGKDGDQ
jgi:hypothetical protein